jgi:hypothetical protein
MTRSLLTPTGTVAGVGMLARFLSAKDLVGHAKSCRKRSRDLQRHPSRVRPACWSGLFLV